MHGGKMVIRGNTDSIRFPAQVSAKAAEESDMAEIMPYIEKFCNLFGFEKEEILSSPFTVITPDSKNPYKQMYVAN